MAMIHVEVTQEDIDKGKPMSPKGCMVALALRRTFGTPVIVNRMGLWPVEGIAPENPNDPWGLAVRWAKRVTTRIDQFDHGERVKPFQFDFKVGTDA